MIGHGQREQHFHCVQPTRCALVKTELDWVYHWTVSWKTHQSIASYQDFSHPPEKLVELKAALEHCEVSVGSRYIEGGSVDRDWPVWRKGLSAWANFYARTILGLPIADCTGGFRIYRREALERMPLDRVKSNGYVFMVEMAYLAYLADVSFREVPIYFADRRFGDSKMSFGIQIEAAFHVWYLLLQYSDLVKPV